MVRALAAITLLLVACGPGNVPSELPAARDVSPLDFELDGPGVNVDDPCFWVNPADPAASLLFVTTKDSGLVEVFNLVSGAPVTTIGGFGKPNNCAVEGDLLLTADRKAGHVKVHHLPDFTLLRTFADDMQDPDGIDVLSVPGGAPRVYVTDSADSTVHVYTLGTGALVKVFPTGLGPNIEPILADDLHQRIYVSRGEKQKTSGIGWFTADGMLVKEFGSALFSGDAEGLAIYACGAGGYLVAADQRDQATEFEVFERQTLEHLGTFRLRDGDGEFSDRTDGIDILQTPVPGFPGGILAVCDGCGTTLPDEMDVVRWERVAGVMGLAVCPGGVAPTGATTPP